MIDHTNMPETVVRTVRECLFGRDPGPDGDPDMVKVEGIVRRYGFSKAKLEEHRSIILALLARLDPTFFKSGPDSGGGWTFLNMCRDCDGQQWGEQPICDDLCSLAIGLGVGKFLLDREMWGAFPGGMPYVVFDDPRTSVPA